MLNTSCLSSGATLEVNAKHVMSIEWATLEVMLNTSCLSSGATLEVNAKHVMFIEWGYS